MKGLFVSAVLSREQKYWLLGLHVKAKLTKDGTKTFWGEIRKQNGRLSQVLTGGQDQETRSKLGKNENLVL